LETYVSELSVHTGKRNEGAVVVAEKSEVGINLFLRYENDLGRDFDDVLCGKV